MTIHNLLLSWSGGKDSALALWEMQRDPHAKIVALLTTVTEGYERISMHGVRIELLDRQASILGLPVTKVAIPPQASNEIYEAAMESSLADFRAQGVSGVVFGDIFLDDLRRYREEKLAPTGMTASFPLWNRETRDLARTFVDAGFRAIVTCVDTQQLDASFAGREINHAFLDELPATVDPCGENGEFHTFVYDGPIFGSPLSVRTGERVLRDERFMYCDVLPNG